MLTNSLSNIAFKSNIKFVSHNEFRAGYSNGNRDDFEVVCAGDAKVGDNIATQGLVYCICGGITANKGIIWHMAPCQEHFNFRRKKMLDTVEKHCKENLSSSDSLNSLILGGGNAEGSHVSLKNSIKKMEELNIDTKKNTSILWHSFYGQPSAAAYNAKEDTWYIPVYGIENKIPKSQIKLVKEKYSDIYISEKDTAFIEDNKIEKNLLNTSKTFRKTVRTILNNLRYTLFPFAFSEKERYERWRKKEDSGEYNFYKEKLEDLSSDF